MTATPEHGFDVGDTVALGDLDSDSAAGVVIAADLTMVSVQWDSGAVTTVLVGPGSKLRHVHRIRSCR